MVRQPDLSDPAFEPTDEELAGLIHRAFAEVGERHERRTTQLRAQIAEGQERSRQRLAQMLVEAG